MAMAYFAGGCFWCMEEGFNDIGIIAVVSGYANGATKKPSYQNHEGHVEAIQVTYDPSKKTYSELVEHFWRNIDPTDEQGQFADRGHSYSTAIYYTTTKEKKIAKKSKQMLEKSGKFDKPIVTRIEKLTSFYPAEDYHQGYAKKNPLQYKTYKLFSGRGSYLKEVWNET